MQMRTFFFLMLTALPVFGQAGPVIIAKPDHEDGKYQLGETVKWQVTVTVGKEMGVGSIEAKIFRGGVVLLKEEKLELKDGKAEISITRNEPGHLLLKLNYVPKDGKAFQGLGGAVVGWEKIVRSAPVPDDFQSFWQGKLNQLKEVPLNAKIVKVDIKDEKIEYYQFTLDSYQGAKVHGQLAKPVGGKNLPALFQVQWAGVYPLSKDWVTGYARQGWLAVNILSHDLPIDESPEFYKAKASKELDDYPGIGNESRETSYFLKMFLGCRRGVDFILSRDDWNKKTLMVHGGSQGGYQSFVTAGLCPEVTAMSADVPAGCDHTGKLAQREPGWPNWASRVWKKRDEKKMLEASRYFDAMNFAPNIKCPAVVGIGLIDTVCPPEGIFATCNQLKGSKEVVTMPLAGHGGDHKAYSQAFQKLLTEQKGK
jgi:cephalosporin-C deacetylase